MHKYACATSLNHATPQELCAEHTFAYSTDCALGKSHSVSKQGETPCYILWWWCTNFHALRWVTSMIYIWLKASHNKLIGLGLWARIFCINMTCHRWKEGERWWCMCSAYFHFSRMGRDAVGRSFLKCALQMLLTPGWEQITVGARKPPYEVFPWWSQCILMF